MRKHNTLNMPKIGDKIYVDSHFYISEGSGDVTGGLATVSRVCKGISVTAVIFVEVKEHPGHSYNWTQFLSKTQDILRKRYDKAVAGTDPDIDTMWIEPGDIIEGGVEATILEACI